MKNIDVSPIYLPNPIKTSVLLKDKNFRDELVKILKPGFFEDAEIKEIFDEFKEDMGELQIISSYGCNEFRVERDPVKAWIGVLKYGELKSFTPKWRRLK